MMQVMAFTDLKEFGTESEVRAKGKYRQEGKQYTVPRARARARTRTDQGTCAHKQQHTEGG